MNFSSVDKTLLFDLIYTLKFKLFAIAPTRQFFVFFMKCFINF